MGSVCAEGAPGTGASGCSADPRTRLSLLLGVGAAVVVLDQLTKWWAVEALEDGRRIDLVWTARFNLVRNDGAAFSLGSGFAPLIAVIALAVAGAGVVIGRRVERRSTLVALGLVLGGAVGNVIDRLLRSGDGFLGGAVVDFIDLQWWPVFNVADMGIVIGGFLLVWLMAERPHGSPVHQQD